MKSSTIAGLGLLAGVAVVEAPLIPILLIGAAVMLTPKYLGGGRPMQRKSSAASALPVKPRKPAATVTASPATVQPAAPPPFEIKQAIYKTISYRVIATSVDFAANMVVIGDLPTAAALSAFGLVGAPLFYFCHEIVWNRLAPPGTRVDIGALRRNSKTSRSGDGRRLTVNRAVAKTVTYEIVTATVDFTANFVATRDLAASGGLTIFSVAVSPILYFGHEKLWDYASARDSTHAPRVQYPTLISNSPALLASV